MGAESSVLQDCHLEDAVVSAANEEWALHPAKKKDGSRVSVFVYKKSADNRELIENAAKQLKVLRHPSILRFIGMVPGTDCQRLVTEPVMPVALVLESFSPDEICAGIYQIIEALAFLHDRGRICHNNVCLSSIYVNDQSGWVLGGMEHLCHFDQATPSFLNKCKSLRDDSTIAPEEKAGKLLKGTEYGHVRDAYAFGVMADGLLEFLVDLGDMTKTFELRIQDEFLNPDPMQRPPLHTLLEDRLFKNDFLEVMNFLKTITLKSEEEKESFFMNIVEKLLRLPVDVVASRLVRHLLSRFVLLDSTADRHLVPHLLTPSTEAKRSSTYVEGAINPILPKTLFHGHVIPELFKIFHVRDKHIRMVLLKHFSAYAEQFDRKTLRTTILPQVLLGLKDSDDALVAQTLNALSVLVRILGADVVVGPARNKIFAEGTPKFVTHPPAEISMAKTVRAMNNLSSDKTAILNEENAINSVQGSYTKDHPKGPKLADIARQADREKRREEARKRAEERKKKREENKKILTHSSPPSDLNYISSDLHVNNDVGGFPDRTHKKQRVGTDEDDYDWSVDDQSESGNVEDEIEQELVAMDSTLPAELESKLKLSSPSKTREEEPPEPVKVDWSDALTMHKQRDISPSHVGKQGALKLKPKSKSSPPPSMPSTSQDEQEGEPPWTDDDWGGGWDKSRGNIQRHNSGSSLVGKGKSSRLSVVKDVTEDFAESWGEDWGNNDSVGSPTHTMDAIHDPTKPSDINSSSQSSLTQSGPLGAEFDIMAIDIKKKPDKEEEFDFFADMAPSVKVEEKLNSLTNALSADKVSSVPTSSSLSFAVMDNVDLDEAGWGDEDLDWDDAEPVAMVTDNGS